jgi:hypothetical protein
MKLIGIQTNERPWLLSRVLGCALSYRPPESIVVVIDDSGNKWFQEMNQLICRQEQRHVRYVNCNTEDRRSQHRGRDHFGRFSLGWNKNYFLHLARNIGATRALLIDDDMFWSDDEFFTNALSDANEQLMDFTFDGKDSRDWVSRMAIAVDSNRRRSIPKSIASSVETLNRKKSYPSGGALSVDALCRIPPFPSFGANETWIWYLANRQHISRKSFSCRLKHDPGLEPLPAPEFVLGQQLGVFVARLLERRCTGDGTFDVDEVLHPKLVADLCPSRRLRDTKDLVFECDVTELSMLLKRDCLYGVQEMKERLSLCEEMSRSINWYDEARVILEDYQGSLDRFQSGRPSCETRNLARSSWR